MQVTGWQPTVTEQLSANGDEWGEAWLSSVLSTGQAIGGAVYVTELITNPLAETSRIIRLIARHGIAAESLPLQVGWGEGVLGNVAVHNLPLFVDAPEFLIADSIPGQKLLLLPVCAANETTGIWVVLLPVVETHLLDQIISTYLKLSPVLGLSLQLLVGTRGDRLALTQAQHRIDSMHAEVELSNLELARKRASLFTLINSSDDFMASMDREFKVLAMNEALQNSHLIRSGVTVKLGHNLLDYFEDSEREQWRIFFEVALKGYRFTVEEVYTEKDQTRYSEVTLGPVHDLIDEHIIGVALFGKDVTRRRMIEERIRHSEILLAEAQRIAQIGSYEIDFSTMKPVWSENLYEIMGVKPSEVITSETYGKCTHPEDKEAAIRVVKDCIKTGEQGSLEHRVVHPDGKIIYVSAICNVVKGPTGQPIKLFGTVQNITERKLAQLEMEKYQQELSKLNKILETRIEERTAELKSTSAELEHTHQQLIQSEKLAALGQLLAGVAHEINSPLGAVQASITTVNELFLQMLELLPQFLRKLSGAQMELFRKAVEYSWFERKTLTSREERESRKQVERLLSEWKISPSDEIARTLVSVGLATKIHEIKDLLQSPLATEMVDMIFYLSQLKSNIDNIGIAAHKTRKTAQALKSYSHNSQQDNRTLVNLQDNINLILTLYHNQMKYGVDLTTNYHDDVVVYGNPDELGQVWTNLLQNALQAMDNKGSICINVFRQADEAVVEFKDSGPGIAPEHLERIFEPYFTTKPQGMGTGLGLSISQSIIQKYHGTVSCVSKPGETIFTVRMKTFSGVEMEDAQMVQTAS